MEVCWDLARTKLDDGTMAVMKRRNERGLVHGARLHGGFLQCRALRTEKNEGDGSWRDMRAVFRDVAGRDGGEGEGGEGLAAEAGIRVIPTADPTVPTVQ